MERALQLSLEDSRRRAGPSKNGTHNGTGARDLESLDEEIAGVERQITGLQALLRELKKKRDDKVREIREAQTLHRGDQGKTPAANIDYSGEFEWTGALYDKLKTVFGFDSFRSCQERYVHAPPHSLPDAVFDPVMYSICNANLDRRDIVAIMPTGVCETRSCHDYLVLNKHRRRQVSRIPAPRADHTRVHFGHLSPPRTYCRPSDAPARSWG